MADKLNPQQRRKCMQSIRSKNTKPELLVRKFLFALAGLEKTLCQIYLKDRVGE